MYIDINKFLKLIIICIGIILINGQTDKEILLPSDCGQSAIDDKIVGGGPAPIGAYPWMAAIGFKGSDRLQFDCAGAVINSRYVLTAAHCLDSGELKRRRLSVSVIHLGDWDLSKDKDCQSIKNRFFHKEKCNPPHVVAGLEDTIIHPLYGTRGKSSDDIALIRLNMTIDFTSDAHAIRPVCLPTKNFDIKTFAGMEQPVGAGWGLTEHGNKSNVLLSVTVPFANDDLCKQRYPKKFVGNQLCVGGDEGFDTCGGDSGGPLVISSQGGPPFVQIGIVSFGPFPCGLQNFPGVYTDVAKYRDWILENIKP